MKLILLFFLVGCCYIQSIAQNPISIKKNVSVTFEKDTTGWVATIIEKDTISVLFKMMFETPPNDPLPPNGRYTVAYSSNFIEFNSRKSKKYIFNMSSTLSTPTKNTKEFYIIGLSRMNPLCYINKE